MSCGHPWVNRDEFSRYKQVRCHSCGHGWREYPADMTDEEYDSCLLAIAAYLIQKAQENDEYVP